MRNDFEKSFLVHIRLLHLSAIFRKNGHRQYTHLVYYISVLYLVSKGGKTKRVNMWSA